MQRVLLPLAVAQDGAGERLRRRRSRGAADGEQRHAPAVQTDLDLLPLLESADIAVQLPPQPDSYVVLGVQREVVPERDPAARAERQVLAHALILEPQLGDDIGLGRRIGGRIAQRLAADLARSGQVALEERRRHRENVRHVVEAQVRIVGGQQRAAVDLQPQQVANRVGVLGTVQAMGGRAAGIRIGRAGAVEGRLQHGGRGAVGVPVRPRPTGRRHRPGAQLAHDLFPRFGVLAHVLDTHPVQRESGRPQPVVVAGYAVAIQDRPGLSRRGRRARFLRLGSAELRVHSDRRRDEPDHAGCQGPQHQSVRTALTGAPRILILALPALGRARCAPCESLNAA